MKKYKDLSITVKVPVMMGIGSLAALAAICLALLMPLRSNSLRDSSEIARLHAEYTKEHLMEQISGSANVIRAYADVVARLAATEVIPVAAKRELLMMEMQALFDSEINLKSMWCILEPEALDGMDEQYVDRTGSNSQGVFAPRFTHDKVTPIEILNAADLYEIPKETGRETITEPAWQELNGQQVQMFSISVPILRDSTFLGVIAADFPTDDLSSLIESFHSDIRGKIVTDKGIVAVHYDAKRVGRKAEYGNREIHAKIALGERFEGVFPYEGEMQYKVYVPIQLSAINKPWFYAMDIPIANIYDNARQTVMYLIVFFLLGVVLISFTGWLLVRPILRNLIRITDVIRRLSHGEIHFDAINSDKRDEIGAMENELCLLVNGLNRTAVFARNIGEGNLNAEYHLLGDNDELGASLLDMRQRLQKTETERAAYARQEQQRNWGTAGLAKFAEILRRDNDNLEALSYNIISNLTKYMEAAQGGMFVLNSAEAEDERVLEMTACYAYDRRKYADQRIHLGEGLVGSCFLEGEPVYMTDVPNSYMSITSGLGDANPTAIYICPLKVNDEKFGVIELASFNEFEPYQLEFVQRVSESIATAISSVQTSIRTKRLLQQTKLQTEEMANQEEELRQNMEEMQATQEEMRRREEELNETIAKLKERIAE